MVSELLRPEFSGIRQDPGEGQDSFAEFAVQ